MEDPKGRDDHEHVETTADEALPGYKPNEQPEA
jgi:hypothetical protein